MSHKNADTVVVLDFETTGLSPNMGDRAIEIGAVLIEHGRITDRFQQLMNPGFLINGFISSYTGISNAMLKSAPDCLSVIREFASFVGKHNLVAHNASFDKKFLDNEMVLAGSAYSGAFACSMLAARRLYQNAPDHKLGTLVRYKRLPTDGVFHRALADAEMTAHLWLRMLEDLGEQYQLFDVPFNLMQKLGRTAKGSVHTFLQKQVRAEPA
ncbi:PolC-type DNA polymerase III [Endozoicomonas sp. ALE010]|uniref:3'-5' exonuclease n=1 Tax=Endozoicomonas sp. ALE010 TaxID=3403081 RepID=UPI003BB4AADF